MAIQGIIKGIANPQAPNDHHLIIVGRGNVYFVLFDQTQVKTVYTLDDAFATFEEWKSRDDAASYTADVKQLVTYSIGPYKVCL